MTDEPDASSGRSPEIAAVRRLLADARHTGADAGRRGGPDGRRARRPRRRAGPRPRTGRRADAAESSSRSPPTAGVGRPDAGGRGRDRGGRRRRRPAPASASTTAVGDDGRRTQPGRRARQRSRADQTAPAGARHAPAALPMGTPAQATVRTTGWWSAPTLHPRRPRGRRLLDAKRRAPVRRPAPGRRRRASWCRRTASCVSATYERAPAVLVFHRPVSSTQVVDLFVCGSSRPVRSATLPHP